jgi:hypothetical protein
MILEYKNDAKNGEDEPMPAAPVRTLPAPLRGLQGTQLTPAGGSPASLVNQNHEEIKMKIMKSNKKSEDLKRSVYSRVRVTREEAKSIFAMAAASGVSNSEFFRRAALGREVNPPRPLPEINRATYAELGRVSGNLQRLFSTISSDKKLSPDIAKQLVAALTTIKKTCQATQQQIIGSNQHD